jgi:hypothetical protein
MKKAKRKRLTANKFILPVIAVVVIGGVVWYAVSSRASNNVNLPAAETTEPEVHRQTDQPTWSSYKNTAHSYSFSYPADLKLEASNEIAEIIPISDTVDVARINTPEVYFAVQVDTEHTGILDEALVKEEFLFTDPADISVKRIVKNGVNGLEAVFKDPAKEGVVSNFYWFQKSANDPIYHVTVKLNSDNSAKIYETLKF